LRDVVRMSVYQKRSARVKPDSETTRSAPTKVPFGVFNPMLRDNPNLPMLRLTPARTLMFWVNFAGGETVAYCKIGEA